MIPPITKIWIATGSEAGALPSDKETQAQQCTAGSLSLPASSLIMESMLSKVMGDIMEEKQRLGIEVPASDTLIQRRRRLEDLVKMSGGDREISGVE